jgi:hypothetical protein
MRNLREDKDCSRARAMVRQMSGWPRPKVAGAQDLGVADEVMVGESGAATRRCHLAACKERHTPVRLPVPVLNPVLHSLVIP